MLAVTSELCAIFFGECMLGFIVLYYTYHLFGLLLPLLMQLLMCELNTYLPSGVLVPCTSAVRGVSTPVCNAQSTVLGLAK